MLEPTSSQPPKWQRLRNIVSAYPMLAPCTQASEFKRLVIKRVLLENAIAFLLQYIGLMLHIASASPMPIWFDAGTACAYTFMRGTSVLPGIFLASALAYHSAQADILLTGVCATLLTLQPWLVIIITQRTITPTLLFYRRLSAILFLSLAGIVTAVVSFLLVLICYSSMDHALSITQQWLQWWLANWNGLIIFGCALVTWDTYFPHADAYTRLNKFTLAIYFGALFLITSALVINNDLLIAALLAVALISITTIISIRYGKCGAVTAVFISGLLLGLTSYLDFSANNQSMYFLQMTLLTQAMTALWLSA
jgi:hypothetical protein